MNVLLLIFSPAGSNAKVAMKIKEKLINKGHEVQLLDITGNHEIFKKGEITEYFEKRVKKHDVICIGSPVYEKHIEMYVKNIYDNLPAPDEKWGPMAIPFFTYGGISSGIALREAEKILRKSGRQVIAAMKIESSHIVTEKLKTRVNVNMPGEEADIVIDDLVDRICTGAECKVSNLSKELNYQKTKEKIVCAIMKEQMLHRKMYGKLEVQGDLCCSCQKCIEKCPIQRIELKNGKACMINTFPECIHCFSCVNVCTENAITYENGDIGWAKIERIFSKVAKEGSMFKSEETPRSIVYPRLNK